MQVRIDDADSERAVLTVSEDADGVNEPASVSLVVRAYGARDLSVHLVGGDPEREDEDLDKPTLCEGVFNGDARTWSPEPGLGE